jgi:hypothetical protein
VQGEQGFRRPVPQIRHLDGLVFSAAVFANLERRMQDEERSV